MVVTGIYKRKGNFHIYLDNELAFVVTDEGLYKLKIAKGDEFVPDERINQILIEDEIVRCKHRAIYMTSVTPKSVKMLRYRLKRENFSENAIEQTIDFMEKYSFVNDVEIAQSVVRSQDRKNSSVRQIKQKLYEKGISKEDQQQILEEMEIDERENAYHTLQKKLKTLRNKSNEEILRKLRYTLSYKGFSYDASRYALDKIKKRITRGK